MAVVRMASPASSQHLRLISIHTCSRPPWCTCVRTHMLGGAYGWDISRAANLYFIFTCSADHWIFRKSPQNLCIDFKHTGPNLRKSPQKKTCARSTAKKLEKSARDISHAGAEIPHKLSYKSLCVQSFKWPGTPVAEPLQYHVHYLDCVFCVMYSM